LAAVTNPAPDELRRPRTEVAPDSAVDSANRAEIRIARFTRAEKRWTTHPVGW
jgi:hypothetical protein